VDRGLVVVDAGERASSSKSETLLIAITYIDIINRNDCHQAPLLCH
jgi:hypothetical protein